MANYNSLKATINANIKANNNQEITGPVLNSVLTQMVNALGGGYQYAGVATPSSNPGTPDTNVFYIAATAGTYTNMGGLVVSDGEVAILKYNGTWTKDSSGFATSEKVNQLDAKVDNIGQLYDKNGNKVKLSEIDYPNGVYLGINGAEGYNALYAVTGFIDLNGLGDITYHGKIIDIRTIPYALFYDSTKTLIPDSALLATSTAQFTTIITPPSGARYVRFNAYCYNAEFYIKPEYCFAAELSKRIEELIPSINSAITNSSILTSWIYDKDGVLTKLADLTDSNGVWIDGNGNYQPGAAYGITKQIYIKGVSTVYYKGYIVDKGIVAIAKFLDESGAFISTVMSSNDNITTNPSVVEITVPSNAYYVQFCCHRTSNGFATTVQNDAINILRESIDNIPESIYDDFKEKVIVDGSIVRIKETPGFCSIINKWGFIGDSLSSGLFQWIESGSEPQFTDYEYSWGQMLIARIGHAVGTNFSVGGLTAKAWYARYITNSTPGYNYKSAGTVFADDLKQAYTIMLGTNDGNSHISVGNFFTDVNLSDYTQNADTFCGNYAKIIQKIKELQPSAKIFVITIPALFSAYAESEGYNAIIRQMASEFNNVFVVDLYALIPSISAQLQNLFRIDGHGTSTGYQWISCIISTIIDNVIENNLDSFKWVCRIGTQYDDGNL